MKIIAVCISVFVPAICVARQDVYQNNIVVVVDASGSMNWKMTGGTKMDLAKDALWEVLSKVPDTTNIGIVVFGRGKKSWIYELGPKNDETLRQAIYEIRTGGGTPLGSYIKHGADRLLEQRKNQFGYGSYRLVIVTDGEADSGSETRMMKNFAPEVISRGLSLDVIGVNMKEKHALSDVQGSRYMSADNPESLKASLREVVAEVGDSNDGGISMEEAFADIAWLSPEAAQAMLTGLSVSGNLPLGEKQFTPKKETGIDNKNSSSGKWIGFVSGTAFCIIVIITLMIIAGAGRGI